MKKIEPKFTKLTKLVNQIEKLVEIETKETQKKMENLKRVLEATTCSRSTDRWRRRHSK